MSDLITGYKIYDRNGNQAGIIWSARSEREALQKAPIIFEGILTPVACQSIKISGFRF